MNSIKNKTQLESDVFDHFQEMRFQIDEHREKLKEKIDDIALEMIDKTKKYENNSFKKILKERKSFYLRLRHLMIEKAFDKQIELN